MSKKPELEICSNNWLSALAADEAGADRIEICSALGEGGVTPSTGLIIQCVKKLSLKTHVLIRARSGDFLYNQDEIEIMKNDVLFCKENGVDGVVFGFLNADGSIDKALTKEFIDLALPMKVTFHRAFDMCKDPFQALQDLIDLNVDYILTSGQKSTALEGAELLAELVAKANGKIKIMAASGVRAHLLNELMEKTHVDAYHLSSRTSFASGMNYKKTTVGMGSESMDAEYKIHTQDIGILKEAKDILRGI